MNKITLTDTGKKILTGTVGQPGIETQYWVGYFGLAYVPESASNDLSGYTTLVGPGESGDYIYNIWQGDLTGNGHTGSSSDFTRLTQYDANLSTNFRYAYDEEKGCNRLITWTTAGSSVVGEAVKYDSYDRIGYAVYEGAYAQQDSSVTDTATTSYTASGIPVPAPLLYLGDNLTYSAGSLSDMADSLGTDWPMTDGGYPMVTPDMRCYSGASVDGASGDDVIASSEARREDYLEDNHMANYKCFVSLSNYNKGHAQVSSEGYETDYQESCHNMSRVTKLFPIAQYEIADADPETKETRQGNANSIKYRLALDFGTDNRAYRDVLNFEDSDENKVTVFEENPNNSFKFNRIGIYAVPVSIRKFRKEGEAGCNHCQVEVDPDENPELVAIISLDEVMLSEDGSKGFTRWAQDFILNMQQVDPEEVPGCVRDVEVYYNMAENEAITWYQNQLLASAGLSEAVTTLGVDVAYLKSMAARPCSDCTTSQGDAGDQYASLYHTHDYMKNLVDAEGSGSVKGIRSTAASGQYSLALGTSNSSTGDFSISMGPWAESDADYSISVSAGKGLMGDSSRAAMLLSTTGCSLTDVYTSMILTTQPSRMRGGCNDVILGSVNYDSIPSEPTVITVAEYLASLNNTGSTSSLSSGWYCFAEDDPGITGTIVAFDTISGEQKTYDLEPPVDGLYYAINVNTYRQPLYSPTITVFSTDDNDYKYISTKYLFRVPSHTNVISLGYQNAFGNDSFNNIVIGHSNDARYTKINNTFILGSSVLNIFSSDRYIGVDEDGEPIQREISNVSVMGELSGNVLGGLKSGNNMATENYRNAHIFLNTTYASPQMFGIFPDPLGVHWNASPDFPIDTTKFDDDGIYRTAASDSSDSWANGLSRHTIHEMINSATTQHLNSPQSVPMIYTGGICLAGEFVSPYTPVSDSMGEMNAGRIKLGSGVLPSAYITAHPVDTWFHDSKCIIPTSIIGTTDCPYQGLVLGLTGQQEIDGTMHIGLYKLDANHGLQPTFDDVLLNDENPPVMGVRAGKRYLISTNEVTISPVQMIDGDECMIVSHGSNSIIFPNLGGGVSDGGSMIHSTLSGPGAWMVRAASYISSNNTTYRGFIVTAMECGGDVSG